MTVREAARRLRRSEATIQRWCRLGGRLKAEGRWVLVHRNGHRTNVWKLAIDARSVAREARRLALPSFQKDL